MNRSRRNAVVLLCVAGACAVVSVLGARLFEHPEPITVSAASLLGTLASWRAAVAARESGVRGLRITAAALLGFLGVALILVCAVAILLALHQLR